MAVERLTDYTRRIWTGLSADAPDPDMQAGDVIYYMDSSQCGIVTHVYPEGSIDVEFLPDIGGGGGGGNVEYQRVDIRNRRKTATQFAYIYQLEGIPGVGAVNNQSISKDGTLAVSAMLIQDGRFVVGCNPTSVTPSSVVFNGKTLDAIIVGRTISVPYMGFGDYEFYFLT